MSEASEKEDPVQRIGEKGNTRKWNSRENTVGGNFPRFEVPKAILNVLYNRLFVPSTRGLKDALYDALDTYEEKLKHGGPGSANPGAGRRMLKKIVNVGKRFTNSGWELQPKTHTPPKGER